MEKDIRKALQITCANAGCEGYISVIAEFIDANYDRANLNIPMGLSNWKEHGKKYGYMDFFVSKHDMKKFRRQHRENNI